jgi:hypothetical protein
MADAHRAFEMFHDAITPAQHTLAALRDVRRTVRERIRRNFQQDLSIPPPKFRGQGAYAMGTLIDPLRGIYEIDDAIYLQHLDSESKNRWPAPEIVHICIEGAAFGQRSEAAEKKKRFIRVHEPGGYGLNLRVYAELKGKFHQAECGAKGWRPADPLALVEWFASAVAAHGEQLRRVVRYIKSWADFQSCRHGMLPGGLILTVLTVQNYFPDARDDIALTYTLKGIESKTRPMLSLLNPTDIGEELTAGMTMAQWMNCRQAIAEAASDAVKAIHCRSPQWASELWRRQIGERFPESA